MTECKLVLFMIYVYQIAAGVRGEYLYLYHRVGDDVTLPCVNVIPEYPNCSSTAWLYGRDYSETIVIFTPVKIAATKHPARDRLSLNPDCSLIFRRVTAQDAGLYICRQLESTGAQYGADEQLYLSLLNISPSPPVTDLKPGTRVTLTCSLFTFDPNRMCDQHIIMRWLDGAGNVVKSNPEEVSGESRCSISLTVTLQEEDNNNRKFRCQLTDEGGNKKTFIDFLVVFSGNNKKPGTVNPTTTTTTQTTSELLILIVPVGGAVVLLGLIAAVFVLCKKRRTESRASSDKIGLNDLSVAMPTVHQSKSQQEDSEDKMTYASISHSDNKTSRHGQKYGGEMVTYATVKPSTSREEEEPVDSKNVYATISEASRAKK